jgi:predicted enzyme related to lactoylglutathione lyase
MDELRNGRLSTHPAVHLPGAQSGRESSAIAGTVPGMAIARFPSIVIDCPDPGALATFYGTMLDWKIETRADWAEVRADYGQCITFQPVEDYTPPRWPAQQVPQQMHLDVMVDDLDAAEVAVLALGATKHPHQPGTSFRVFLDPAGHPFCLCVD